MRKLIVGGLILILAACGTAAGSTSNTSATRPPAASTPAVVNPGTTITPADTNLSGQVIAPGTVEAAAAQSISQVLNVGADQLRLVSKEEREWSDASLGCPASDGMYAQVITPGYLMTMTDGANTYKVHTDQSGMQAVVCEAGQPRK